MATPTYDDGNLSVISQININATDYRVKDSAARTVINAVSAQVETNTTNIATNAGKIADLEEEVKGGVHYRGKVKEILTDGSDLSVVTLIDGETETSLTASAGDLVHSRKNEEATTYDLEFIYSGKSWSELGSTSGLGDLAYKDEVSGTYTPGGSVNITAIADATYDLANGILSGTEATLTTDFAGNATTLTTTFSGDAVSATASFTGTAVTPSGSFTGTEQTLSATFSGTGVTPTGSFTGTECELSGTFKPEGTISKPGVTVDNTKTATTGTATVNNEILTISFGTALTSVTAELDATPTFTGTEANIKTKGKATGSISIDAITPSGNIAVEKFTPTGNISINEITPAGSIVVDSFTPSGTIADISYTPSGSVGSITYKPEGSVTGKVTVAGHTHGAGFTGTPATITSK